MSALQDKVILIVGGTSGLGGSAALACARAGARVVVVGRSAEKAQALQFQLQDACRVWLGDAQHPATAENAVELAHASFGGLHGVFHVAGGSARGLGDGPLHQISDPGLEAVWQWNLRSVVYSNRAAVRHWLKHSVRGVVLNMTSVLATRPSPGHFATHGYAAAKAGIIGLTHACAAYYAGSGIRFNAIAPGLVRTPMSQRAAEDPEIQLFIRNKQPLAGGMCAPEDLDAAVVFLLSDQSAMITGQVLAVDGGWSVSEGLDE